MESSLVPGGSMFWFIIILSLWSIPWKAVALWKAARRGDRWWFVVILLLNTAGILEIIYIFYFSSRGDSVALSVPNNEPPQPPLEIKKIV